ncbi:3-deoxy-D-manno-octulosonate 8-phosphate phosphatase (KDO 8-P phosphatase) [Desulfonatronum thiosulfatophilum]|uniref:3-deoxy-D-manno-octulosonate 8-phosphate phosphatase (KDO 8-P phosphatase) n=1 Tax=Desulfonatronum thiosulfatophilum TaxID=617002 RepID=A0A1G6ATI9_9BACT|nr:HAD hydrolase family protein [Desulfonatronum thiosulfatophilum]SDB11726.1 3-deoxy-D-manno-octulosonate 8-phosphate phosphatase (KDO 8-P phosphatase) [Desulfonatronum thiosulfatophilum]
MTPEQRARRIALMILDVDGVLTDGGLYYDDRGAVSKRFNVQDGLGIKMAQNVGLEFAVISGLDATAVGVRIKELDITEYHPGHKIKVPIIRGICERKQLEPGQIAYLGDDWVDAAAMRMVGLPMAVANAQPEIKELAAWTSAATGGNGAVREAIRFILTAQGKYADLWRHWLTSE